MQSPKFSEGAPAPTVLILRAGALGDFVLTLPALRALRQRFASHRIILAARPDVLPLVVRTLADDVLSFDSPLLTPLFSADLSPEQLPQQLADLALAVLWLPEQIAPLVSANLRRLDAQRLLVANPLPRARHAADHLLDSLAPLGIVARDSVPQLALDATTRAFADPFWKAHALADARVVALHMGSGGAAKRWPLAHFVALAEQLAARADVRVLLVHGPAEAELMQTTSVPASLLQLASPPLPQLAAVLARCALFVGNDSGVTHLAAALGTRTIALFGPTDPEIWAPRGAHVTVIRSPAVQIDELPVAAVRQVIEQHLA